MRTLKQIERVHKTAIRDRDEPSELALRRVHTLLLGVYAESRLRKIIDDPTGFDDQERRAIWLKQSQDQRWVETVERAARRHYHVAAEPLLDHLPDIPAQRISDVTRLLRTELAPIITDRNRLAHGQWVWQLKSRSEDTFVANQSTYDFNYVALRARYDLLDYIGRLVNVLCVSEPTFDRDFDVLMHKIRIASGNLDGSTYSSFADQLRRSKKHPAR